MGFKREAAVYVIQMEGHLLNWRSGRTIRGIPALPGSKTGIDPAKNKFGKVSEI